MLPGARDEGQEPSAKGDMGTYWGDRNVVYLDCGGGYMTVHVSEFIKCTF